MYSTITKPELFFSYYIAAKSDGQIFKIADAVKTTGLAKSRIQFYVDNGVIVPAKESTGRGSHREFNRHNIVKLSIVAQLADRGVGIRNIANILEKLNEQTSETSKDLRASGTIKTNQNIDLICPDGLGHPDFKSYIVIYFYDERKPLVRYEFIKQNDAGLGDFQIVPFTNAVLINLTAIWAKVRS